MLFQASDSKGKNFLELLDDDLKPLEPSSIKEGPWLQCFGHSNSLYAHSSRAIMNHAPIGEYQLWFSLMKNLCVHAVIILLKQDNIFYMNVKGLTIIGT